MSTNTLEVMTAISKEISRRFDVKADVLNSFNRQYDKPHTAYGSNSGSSIKVKLPQRLTGTASATLNIQNVVEKTTTITTNNDYHVGLGFTAAELTQDLLNPRNMKLFADDFLEAAIDDIIAYEQTQFATYMKSQVWNSVGTPGTGPTTLQVVTQARARLNNARAPRSNRVFLLDPDNAALLNNGQNAIFNPSAAISQNYEQGSLSPALGFMFKESPDMVAHTTGSEDGNYVVNGASQTGSSLAINTGTGTLTAGDIFTIADVYAVDPVSGTAKKYLQQFVVTSAYAGGAGSVSIAPSIDATGAYKTVSALPANGAAITVVGTASTQYGRGIAAHRDSFIYTTAELADIGVKYEIPIITGGAGDGYSRDGGPQKGIYMKLYMDGDITNRRAVARLDIRSGRGTLMPDWATAIQGA